MIRHKISHGKNNYAECLGKYFDPDNPWLSLAKVARAAEELAKLECDKFTKKISQTEKPTEKQIFIICRDIVQEEYLASRCEHDAKIMGFNHYLSDKIKNLDEAKRRWATAEKLRQKLNELEEKQEFDDVSDKKGFQSEENIRHKDGLPPSKKEKALKIFGLVEPVEFDIIKASYRAYAKKYHPDTNAGTSQAEMNFKKINAAYSYLKSCYEKK